MFRVVKHTAVNGKAASWILAYASLSRSTCFLMEDALQESNTFEMQFYREENWADGRPHEWYEMQPMNG